MKPASTALAVLLVLSAAPAFAEAALQLTTGKVFTDAAGAYVSVAVKNSGTAAVSEVYVACEFFAGNRALGKSSTTVFSIVGGTSGSDQVRLLGGTGATRTACTISGQK